VTRRRLVVRFAASDWSNIQREDSLSTAKGKQEIRLISFGRTPDRKEGTVYSEPAAIFRELYEIVETGACAEGCSGESEASA